jgi:hypothetical protein
MVDVGRYRTHRYVVFAPLASGVGDVTFAHISGVLAHCLTCIGTPHAAFVPTQNAMAFIPVAPIGAFGVAVKPSFVSYEGGS